MANIKISELNEITKKAYDDYLPIVDSSASETKKISVKDLTSSNVELLAVSDTAPSECSEGDKYYNTETGLIYTATDTDTWGTVGEEPIEDILYVVFSEKNTYAWNGTDMLSVGGGSGSEIVVEPDEPTEDTKLIIEESDLDFQGLAIVNEYSEAEDEAYSCDYVNGKVLYENASGNNGNITLSENYSNYKYLLISYKKSDNDYYETALIPTAYNKFRLDYTHEGNTLLSNGYSMSGQTITRDDGYYFKITTDEYYTGSWIYIYKVVGHN